DPTDPDCQSGSIIRCESQALGERIGLAGTSYQLTYASDRVAGRRYRLDVPLTVGVTIPASLRRVEVDVTIAGGKVSAVYPPARDLVFSIDWDRRDAYGRIVQGHTPYAVEIRYVYPAVYQRSATAPMSFALASGVSAQIVPLSSFRAEYILFQRYT